MKCRFCKKDINKEHVALTPQKNRAGELKYTKNGKQLFYYAHVECDKARQEFNDLIQYVESKYFSVKVPKEFIIKIRQLKNVSMKDIHDCFISIELNIAHAIARIEFNNDIQKSNYIVAILSNHINTFMDSKNKQVVSNHDSIGIELIDRDSIEVEVENLSLIDLD